MIHMRWQHVDSIVVFLFNYGNFQYDVGDSLVVVRGGNQSEGW